MTSTAEQSSNYPTVMQSIRGRLLASNDALTHIEEDQNSPENWKRLDFVTLQVRKTCELILLGSALAHLDEGEAEINARKWRPKDAFAELSRVNDNPLPIPIHRYWSVQADGSKQIVPASKPLPFQTLTAIYGVCGDLLHVPSAAKVLAETVTAFDVAKFRGWVNGFAELMSAHVLMLPDIKRIIVCRWHDSDTDIEMILMEGDGAAFFDMSNLGEFDLVKA